MKKVVLMLVAVLVCTTMSAQLVTGTTYTKAKKEKSSALWLDMGVGSMKDVDGIGVDLGLRWNTQIMDYLSWDVFKIKAQANTDFISESLTAQALTGLRAQTPVLFGNATAFAALGLGYGYCFDVEAGGLDWDLSVGINITPRIMLGVGYNDQAIKIDGYTGHFKYTSFRVGFNF